MRDPFEIIPLHGACAMRTRLRYLAAHYARLPFERVRMRFLTRKEVEHLKAFTRWEVVPEYDRSERIAVVRGKRGR